jgi:hypothetical protein
MIFNNKRRNNVKISAPSPKGVRFNDECNQVLEIQSVMTIEEGIVEKLWYSPSYHKENKQAIRDEAREWRKTGLGILLQDTFVSPNAPLAQHCLNAFAQLAEGEYMRGIERHLCREHDEQRVKRRRNFVQDVLEQARYLESHPFLSEDEKRTKLAEFSALQSKCAEVFARRLGKADETAILQGENPKFAARLASKLAGNEMRRSRSYEVQSNVMPTHESKRRVSFPVIGSGNVRWHTTRFNAAQDKLNACNASS